MLQRTLPHIKDDGETLSKRKDSTYRSGRSPHWAQNEERGCAAVKREEEEDWGKQNPSPIRPSAKRTNWAKPTRADLTGPACGSPELVAPRLLA
jgi:hypothetical protein